MKFLQPAPLGRVHRLRAVNTVRHYGPWLAMAWGLYRTALGIVDADPDTDPLITALVGPGLAARLWLGLGALAVFLLLFVGHDHQWCPRCQTHPRNAATRAARNAYTLHLAHQWHSRYFTTAVLFTVPLQLFDPNLGVIACGAVLAAYSWVLAVHRSLHMACQWCPHELRAPNLQTIGVTDHHGPLTPWRACLYWAWRMDRARRTILVFHHRHPGHTLSLSCDSTPCNDGITTTSSTRSVQWLNHHVTHQHIGAHSHGFLLSCTECEAAHARRAP